MIDFDRRALRVLQAQSGDRDALESLLRDAQSDLLPYISRLVGAQGAEDVLQETLLQICRNLKWLRTPEVFRAWSYRIATRAAFTSLKRERRWSGSGSEQSEMDELPGPSDPEIQLLFSEVPDLLNRTSPASRAVLLLHFIKELPLDEVAAILNLNIGTVKSRLSYGLAALRKSLKK